MRSQGRNDYPRGIVRDTVNGKKYRIIGVVGAKYMLVSEEVGADGKRDKKLVRKDDPKDRYEPIGLYKE